MDAVSRACARDCAPPDVRSRSPGVQMSLPPTATAPTNDVVCRALCPCIVLEVQTLTQPATQVHIQLLTITSLCPRVRRKEANGLFCPGLYAAAE